MTDYKYQALQIDRSYRGLSTRIRTGSIRPVAASFVQNMDRTVSLAEMPLRLMHYATWLGFFAARAHYEEDR